MVFYDRNWNEIGTKWSLQREISRITAISTDHIAIPRTAGVAAKMSWASRKQTTRPEDMSYCLMGLFDVNMPLLYGEGSKAFIRLQLEIVKSSYDESIFAWKDDTLISSGFLALSPAAFSDSGSIIPIVLPELGRSSFAMTHNGITMSTIITVLEADKQYGSAGEDDPLQTIQLRCARTHPYQYGEGQIVLMLKSAGPSRCYQRRWPDRFLPDENQKPRIGIEARIYIPHHYEKYQSIRRANSQDQHSLINTNALLAGFTLYDTYISPYCLITSREHSCWRLLIKRPSRYGVFQFKNFAGEIFVLIVTTFEDLMPGIDLVVPNEDAPTSKALKYYGDACWRTFPCIKSDRLSMHLQHETHIFIALRKKIHGGQKCYFVDIDLL